MPTVFASHLCLSVADFYLNILQDMFRGKRYLLNLVIGGRIFK